MDRDTAYVEVVRLLERYRSMPFTELLSLADEKATEIQVTADAEVITLSVDVRHSSDGAVQINVSALGNNWWKTDRLDESVRVSPDGS